MNNKSMFNGDKFQDDLQNLVLKRIIFLTVVATVVFLVTFYGANLIKYQRMTEENFQTIESLFTSMHDTSKSFLLDDETKKQVEEVVKTGKEANFINYFNRFNRNNSIDIKYILVNDTWKILSTSINSQNMTTSLYNTNNAISNNSKNLKPNEVYTSVYDNYGGYPDYIMIKPFELDNGHFVFLSFFHSGSDWSFLTSNSNNYNSVITDYRDNVIFYNKSSLIQNNYKFLSTPSQNYRIGNDRYWIDMKSLDDYKVNIYSVVYYPTNPELFISFGIILFISALMYRLSKWMSQRMAEKNAYSVNLLASEIQHITTVEPEYRVQIYSNDEFEHIGHQINTMLDTIKELNDQNTELIQFNNAIEISQLTAQINPHFLYNTLDTIRNLVAIDPVLSKKVILDLTRVLRYSIDNRKPEVYFEEDLEFINNYLSIQKIRFGDRLKVNFEIDEACKQCIVPKLVLQPIIENSIKYGFKKRVNLEIDIKGTVADNFLILQVKDNGLGIDEKQLKLIRLNIESDINLTNSHGLFNIARRLRLQHTNESKMELTNKPGKGLTVTLRIFQKKGIYKHV